MVEAGANGRVTDGGEMCIRDRYMGHTSSALKVLIPQMQESLSSANNIKELSSNILKVTKHIKIKITC